MLNYQRVTSEPYWMHHFWRVDGWTVRTKNNEIVLQRRAPRTIVIWHVFQHCEEGLWLGSIDFRGSWGRSLQGIVAAVDEADQTVKLEQLVDTQDGFIRIEVPILDWWESVALKIRYKI